MINTFYTAFDTEPFGSGQSRHGKGRTPFEQDRDRIIYSPAFRRLQSKTQVFLSGEFDFYRTRLTHSIEVSQIGRSIVNHLNRTAPALNDGFRIDQDLVESVCLAHDIGHPSFGHAGEQVLNELMRGPAGGFEGNAQNLRILVDLFYRDKAQWAGMKPTRAFLDGMLKYKTLYADSVTKRNHFLYDFQRVILDFISPDAPVAAQFGSEEQLNGFKSLECRIMDWADDIAYSVHDLDDGIRAGFVTVKTLSNWLDGRELDAGPRVFVEGLRDAILDDGFSKFLAQRIGEFIHATTLVERENFLSDRTNRYRYDIAVEPERKAQCAVMQAVAVDLVFRTPQVQQLEFKGGRILRGLFTLLEGEYVGVDKFAHQLLPAHYHARLAELDDDGRRRVLCDYLSGMTDGFVVRTYKRLFDPDFGSIIDLI